MTNLYEIDSTNKVLVPLTETEFGLLGFRERNDIQEWIANNPEILGEDLLIIAKEFSAFDMTNERADLIALDRDGNLVIIELKRDDSGTEVHWQAIKYASYFRKVKPDQIVKINAEYKKIDEQQSVEEIVNFINSDNELAVVNQKQRIILASHRFAREVTSAILWLSDYAVDIKCIEIIPFKDENNHGCFIMSNTLLPVPGTESFEISASIGDRAITINSSGGTRKNNDWKTAFLADIAEKAIDGLSEITSKPNRRSRWAGTWSQIRYYKLWYNSKPWDNRDFSFQLHIYNNNNKWLGVRFFFSVSYAKNCGYSDEQIEKLIEEMKKFARDNQLMFSKEVDSYVVERYFDQSVKEESSEVIKILVNLIEYITPIVENLNEI